MNARRVALIVLVVGALSGGAAFLLRRVGSTERRGAARPEETREQGPSPGRDSVPREKRGTVRVLVVAGGAPVPGAHVTLFRHGLEPHRGRTGTDGVWISPAVGEGEWEVGVRQERFMAAAVHADVRAGAQVPVTIELQTGARAQGRVTDTSGNPIRGVEVTVMHPATLQPMGLDLKATTDAEGKYAIDAIPPVAVALWFVSSRHRTARSDLTFTRPGEILEADARLVEANQLSGFVRDEADRPIEKAIVQAWNDLGSTAETDATGRFTIQRLGDGPAQVAAQKKGYGTVYLRDVAPNRTDVVIRLPKAGAILGRVDADPAPEECEVKLWRYDEHHRRELMVRGSRMPLRGSRAFRMEDVGPGMYTLTAEAPGWELESPVPVAVERERLAEAPPLRLRRK